MDNNVVISDYQQMDRILREERNYLLNLCKAIQKSGCNVLLIQKSILRDAVTDLSLHYLAKMKILVVKDIEREDIEFISRVHEFLNVLHLITIPDTQLCSYC
jgi:T-complex protein 1 subunit delta